MIQIAFLRHGVTAWNLQGRIQGRTDSRLSPRARRWLASRALPAELTGWRVVVSPLRRARETAALLGLSAPELAPALLEMSWGQWEGCTLAALRARHGAAFAAREAQGLDFRPPGGESPRLVQRRLQQWLRSLPASDPTEGVVAIAHKGVIRAALALASGWDMRGPPPLRIDWRCLQLFSADALDRLTLVRGNLPLAVKAPPAL